MSDDKKNKLIKRQATRLSDALLSSLDQISSDFMQAFECDENERLSLKIEALTMALLKTAENSERAVVQLAMSPNHWLGMGVVDSSGGQDNNPAIADTKDLIEKINNLESLSCTCPACQALTNTNTKPTLH